MSERKLTNALLFYIRNKSVLKPFREGVKMIFVLSFFFVFRCLGVRTAVHLFIGDYSGCIIGRKVCDAIVAVACITEAHRTGLAHSTAFLRISSD